jgi:hypothetical protein
MSAISLGKVNTDVAEAFAYLMSPSAIDGEIRRLRECIGQGNTSPATSALLNDWETIKTTQARLMGGPPQQGE